jgi:HSP20 family molecular chaperone IbpA
MTLPTEKELEKIYERLNEDKIKDGEGQYFRRINISDLTKNKFELTSVKNKIVPAYDMCNLKSPFEDSSIIEVALPGFTKEQISIKLENNKLHITALYEFDNSNYTRKEIPTDYNFIILLDYPVDIISAKLKNGILSITVKKLDISKNIIIE